MNPFAESYFHELETAHKTIAQVIEGLPQAALDWTPGPETNSMAVLVKHVAGAEQFWLGDVIMQTPTGRDRPAEFATRGLDGTALAARIHEATAYARQVLETLALDDLAAERVSPRDGQRFTVAYCLNHILAHTAQHLGHIEAARQWWEETQ